LSVAGGFDQGTGQLDEAELELPSVNDLIVLDAIGNEQGQNVSFQGIKRKLGFHQETLSRSLHRLERDGYVERLEHAYRASPKGLETLLQGRVPSQLREPENYGVPVIRAMLPQDANIRELIDSLSYRWFGNLRWLGSTETESSATLTWITSDSGVKISAKIKEDSISIETVPPQALSSPEVVRSAYDLFDQVWKSFKSLGKMPSQNSIGRAA
jgi:DNA-binding MarR family transcriptional regulator